MSALRVPAKQPRMMNQSMVMRTESVELEASAEVKNPPTSTHPASETGSKSQTHPKGHRARDLQTEVFDVLDKQEFLRLSDTLALGDFWCYPISVETIQSANIVFVKFMEIVAGYHIKHREAVHKITTDDLCKICYLNDCIQWDLQGFNRVAYDDWLADKTAKFIKACGVEDAHNRAKVCQYILTEDKEFTFYPRFLKSTTGIFFRKSCVHTYKKEGESKIENPLIMKCSTKGKFEYVIEAKIIPLPIDWFEKPSDVEESQLI